MKFIVSNKICVEYFPPDLKKWCEENLVLDNPEYHKKERMGLWLGNTPKKIALYSIDGEYMFLPFGCLDYVWKRYGKFCKFERKIADLRQINYHSNINLYPYQQEAVEKALRAKNGVIVMPCGAGKTQTALELIARIGGKALWLTHTQDLLHQSMNRAKSVYDLPTSMFGTITGGKVNISAGITFATVQTMSKLDLMQYRNDFDIVVVDECMPSDTKIATPYGYKLLKNLCNGDIITSYNRTTGKTENKKVINTFKSKAHDIVNVNLSNGEIITCTGNHPIFTQKGWVDAERLEQNDYVMRMVWERGRDRQYAKNKQAQSIGKRMVLLFKRMLYKGWSQEGCVDGRAQKKGIRSYEEDKRRVSFTDSGKNDKKQSYEKSRNKRKGIKAIKRNRASSTDKMWKRYGTYCATANNVACTCRKGRGICRVSYTHKKNTGKRIPNLLQGRYCNPCGNDRSRGGWKFTLCNKATRARQKERNFFEWIRVDGVEVQKQTGDGTFGGLCSDGYVYNIEVEDNNNYFANGILVHNCHKAVGSPTKVMQFYKVLSNLSCRYKFGITATPKRADGLEQSMFALLGGIIQEVSREAVAETTCPIKVECIETGYQPNYNVVLMGDGTINYARLVEDLITNEDRYNVVFGEILIRCKDATIVLANRVEYLKRMNADMIGCGKKSICLSGASQSKKAKAERKEALRKLNDGEIDCVFCTYQLASEGLDVPNLKYVVFATPEKDQTRIQQASGRVGRKALNKDCGIVIDFVDSFGMYQSWKKKRETVYNRLKYDVME